MDNNEYKATLVEFTDQVCGGELTGQQFWCRPFASDIFKWKILPGQKASGLLDPDHVKVIREGTVRIGVTEI